MENFMKISKKKIALIGGGSVNWNPHLIVDICLKECVEEIEFQLLDINLQRANLLAQYGRILNTKLKTNHKFIATDNYAKALNRADFVVITISTGGFDAMEYDLSIAEKYRVYATVGDTVGPSGWSRSIRNIPVFRYIGEQINKYCPNAVVLNYTNPMASLTATLCKIISSPVVGLCHGIFENYEILQNLFNAKNESDIQCRCGGLNHFFWMMDVKVNQIDVKKRLLGKIGKGSIDDLMKTLHLDPKGFGSNKYLASELIKFYDALPYLGDRHTCEFFPHIITGDTKEMKRLKLIRTTIKERRKWLIDATRKVKAYISGKKEIPIRKTRETCADIMEAFIKGKEFIDVMNIPNKGQISNLPENAVVETLGAINAAGFHPISIGALPERIAELCRPHAVNQVELVEGMFTQDKLRVMHALYNDPCCRHLNFPQRQELGKELIKANIKFLPRFMK
jgi:alpha-galactosidase